MQSLKSFLLVSCSIFATFLACSENPLDKDVEKANVAIEIVADATSDFGAVASSAEVKVSAEGMPTLTQALTVTTAGISGTVTGIVAGPGRKFEVFVYDAADKLCYYGSSIGEVSAGGTANISLTLYRTNGEGNANINGTIQGSNTPPTVSLTSPANNALFTVGSPIQLAATATDADGSVSSVKFYSGSTLLSTDNTSPYSYSFTPSTAGTYSFSAVATDNAGASTTSATVSVTVIAANQTSYKINCGGSAASPYTVDGYYSGGSTSSTTSAITTTGITNPAPAAVYQVERYGNTTYTFPNLVSGASYNVRLHFVEIYWTASAKRRFNVAINGNQVLSNFDIYATAGAAKKAVVREFTVTANSSGQIIITLTTVTDNASICGIEIIPAALPPVITGPTSQTTCLGTPATLSVSATGGSSFTYQWYSGTAGSGTAIADATTANYSTSTAGTYYCVVTNNSGLSASSSAATVTVSTASSAPTSISATLTQVCPNGSTTLTIVGGSLGAGATWKWYSNAGLTVSAGSGTSITATVVSTTTYYVRAEGGCNGNTATASRTISTYTPISFTTQPTSVSTCQNFTSYFSVSVTGGGTGYVYYQWKFNGSPVANGTNYAGATTPTLTVLKTTTSTIGSYTCTVDNGQGCSVTSNSAALSMESSPLTITAQPTGGNINPGEYGGLSVSISGGTGTYSYQWYKDGSPMPTSTCYSPSAGTGYMIYLLGSTAAAGDWYCEIQNSNKTGCPIASNHAIITSSGPCSGETSPVITGPANQTTCLGTPATLSISVTGGSSFTYQWYRGTPGSGLVITGATTVTYSTSTSGSYYCVVTNNFGLSATSSVATVTVNSTTSTLTITTQPQSAIIDPGSYGAVSVTVTGGTGSYSYQWYHNGSPLGSGSDIYHTGTGTGYMDYIYGCSSMAGDYYCVIQNSDLSGCPIQSNHVTITTSGSCPTTWP